MAQPTKTLLATPEQVRAFRAGATAFLVPIRAKSICLGSNGIVINVDRLRPISAPYAVGSVVAVKEAFALPYVDLMGGCDEEMKRKMLYFRADHDPKNCPTDCVSPDSRACYPPKWEPAQHMPPWAVRIHLTVTAVAPQLVSEISEADAKACGYRDDVDGFTAKCDACFTWQTRYGEKFPWAWLCRAEVKL